jgi:hypothetical protein
MAADENKKVFFRAAEMLRVVRQIVGRDMRAARGVRDDDPSITV